MNPISTYSFLICAIGAVFVLILFVRLLEIQKSASLSKYRSKDAGVADLLNWASVIEDGIIVNKDGSLMVTWMYQAEDSANATDEEKNYVAARLNQTFAKLGDGWMVHFDSIRRETSKYSDPGLSHFPDRITAAIDNERRRQFETQGVMYEGSHVLSLTWLPPLLSTQKFVELMFDDEGETITPEERSKNILTRFQTSIQNFESELSSVFKLARLKGRLHEDEDGKKIIFDDQLQYIQYCLTGISQPIRIPESPTDLDVFIGGQDFFTGVIPLIGDNFIQVVAIEGFPVESYPGILGVLSDIPIQCRFSNRFIFMDQHQAAAAAEKQRKKWKQKERGLIDTIMNKPISPDRLNQDAINMVRDATEAITEINEGIVAYGYYTGTVILMDNDRSVLEEGSRTVAKMINSLGFTARVETINTVDAFLGSLPGHGVQNVRRPHVSTLTFAHFVPTSSIWTGYNYAPCPFYPPASPPLAHCITTGNTPYRFNLHQGDVGHSLIVGRTGGGKSTLMAFLIAQTFRYRENTVFAFDKGMSLFPLCAAAGGNHFDIGDDDSDLCFSPLRYMMTPSDKAWGAEWIEKMLILNGMEITPQERNSISAAIDRIAESRKEGHEVSMDEFLAQVQSNEIREALQPYGIDGPMGSLLGGTTDGLSMSRFNVFEIEKLMSMSDRFALPVLDYLFRRIYLSLDGQPAWIFLDEAWLMLQHPVFAAQIREWLKVLRKANCAVVMATQNLDDFAKSIIFSEVLSSTSSKIFLPNVHARNEDTADTYKRMGLNNAQIGIVAQAEGKRHYYHVTDDGKRLVELGLGPIARCFVAASDKESIATIKDLRNEYGDKWPSVWVKRKTGIDL